MWGGKQKEILFSYLTEQSNSTDIFCFQEVFSSVSGPKEYKGMRPILLEELKVLLPEFELIYFANYEGWIDMEKVDFEVSEGQAIFVKKSLKVISHGALYIFGNKDTKIQADFINEPKSLVYAEVETGGKMLLIVNVHGQWYPGEKIDTPERIEQSQRILNFLSKYNCQKIVCGDFNLMPNTKSIAMLNGHLRNLIRDFAIENTRNEISWGMYKNQQKFADFTFVTKDIGVNSFSVPYNLVSDHLPMELEFSI